MKASLVRIACVVIPKGLGGVLTIALSALLMRYMGPAEFGVWAMCLLMVALADGVLGSAIDMSVVKLASSWRTQDAHRAAQVERAGVVLKAGMTAAVLLLAAALAAPLSRALFHREDPALLLSAVATAGGVLLMRSAFLHLQLEQRFGGYAALETSAQVLRTGGVLAVVWLAAPSAWLLSMAALAGTVIAVLLGAWLTRGLWARSAAAQGRKEARGELLHNLRWILLTFAFSALLSRVDILLLTQWSDMEQVGLFAGGQIYAQIPELLGTYLAVVFAAKVAPYSADGRLAGLMRKVQPAMLVLALGTLAMAVLALQFGEHWLPAAYTRSGEVLLLLLAGTLAAMSAFPLVIPYVMFAKPTFIFKLDLLSLPLMLVGYWLAIRDHGAIGAAWVTGIGRLVKLGILHACAWHWAHQGVRVHQEPRAAQAATTPT